MSDPFSVAGSAVGVISLGISVCSGLMKFISQIKNKRSERLVMEAWLDQLADFLEELQSVISGVSLSTDTSLHSSDASITTLATAIEKLRCKLLLSGKNQKSNSNLTDCLRKWGQGLTYPFTREDLLFLKDSVQNLQFNLIVALQALQLAQQQHNHVFANTRLADLSQLTVFNTQTVRNDVNNVQSKVDCVHNALQPLCGDWPMMMAQLTTIASSVKHLETKLTDTAVDSYSPFRINRNIRQTHRLHQQIANAPFTSSSSSGLRSLTIPHCQCRSDHKSQAIVKRSRSKLGPIALVLEAFEQHSEHCPFAFYSKTRTSIALSLCFCSYLLRRKVRVVVQLLRQNGDFSITPTLRAVRIVPWDSPAFKLIWDLGLFPQYIDTSHVLIPRLRDLFETNQASPYDRSSSGFTLLHLLCHAIIYNLDIFSRTQYRSHVGHMFLDLALFLSKAMGDAGAELDDEGSSAFEMFSKAAIFRNLCRESGSFEAAEMYCTALQNLHQHDLLKPTDIHANFTASVLTKSAVQLQENVTYHADYLERDEQTHATFIETAAVLGWREGCNILLNTKLHPKIWFFRKPLIYALSGGDPGTVQLFLRQRRKTGNTSTLAFRDLEEAIALEFECSNKILCVKQLIKQRRQIERLVKAHLDPHRYLPRDGRILDAGVRAALVALNTRGLKIRPYQYAFQASLYHNITGFDLGAAERLYAAGFRDVQASCFRRFPDAIPPLVWHSMNSIIFCSDSSFTFCKWLVSKGASLSEAWKLPKLTAWKFLAWRAGERVASSILNNRVPVDVIDEDFLLSLLALEVEDTCSCSCSPRGCSTTSLFLRAALERISIDTRTIPEIPERHFLFILTSHIAPIIRAKRELATSVFRVLTCWQLQHKHTCCSVRPIIQAYKMRGLVAQEVLEYFQQGYMNSSHVQRIFDMDEEKRKNLEEEPLDTCLDDIVQVTEIEFQASNQDIVPFVMGFWRNTMLQKLQDLAIADDKNYRTSREQLGVKVQVLDISRFGLIGEVNLNDRLRFWDPEVEGGAFVAREFSLRIRDLIPGISTLDEREWVMPPQDLNLSEEQGIISDEEIFPEDELSARERFNKLMEEAGSSDDDSDNESSDDDSEDDFFVDAET